MKIRVIRGQNIWDVALKYTGLAYNGYDIAIANNVSVTDELAGMELIIPDVECDKKIQSYYDLNAVNPVSNTSTQTVDSINYFERIFDLTFD